MNVTFKWDGASNFRAIEEASTQLVAEVTAAIEASAKQEAGRLIYETPESPSYVRTGNLLNNITSSASQKRGEVFSNAEYSLYVHEGTQHMAARPFLSNAVTTVSRTVETRARRIFNRRAGR
jgi:HK97 gp10 family phage protein